jgi:hypothetical protein
MNIRDINPNPHNPRKISGERLEKLAQYLEEYGDISGIVYNSNPECQALVSGHQRMQVFRKGKGKPVIIERYDPPQADGTVARGFIELKSGHRYVYREVHWEKEKADAATIIANGQFGEWDSDILANEWEFDMPELREMGVPEWVFGEIGNETEITGTDSDGATPTGSAEARKSLAERFIIPPFSVFDTRQGYWQTRKRQWLALGIKSELGRGGAMTYNDHEWQRGKLGKVQAFTGGKH